MVTGMPIPFMHLALSADEVHGQGAVAVEESAAAILWLVILLAMVLFGGVVAMLIRKRYRSVNDEPLPSIFSLDTLRKMKNKGELTEEEFKRACEHLHRDAIPSEPAQAPHASIADPDQTDQTD
tara:strand:- start:36128 stop:36499 length:372 start_codon:yes stop_codon:yes gene_type:complete